MSSRTNSVQQLDDETEIVAIASEKKLIIVTGFGPFAGHEEVNASWEAVRLLPDSVSDWYSEKYQLEKILVPVVYEEVDRIVEEVWSKNPYLVIHCGVHGGIDCIHVEEIAPTDFPKKDFTGKRLTCPKVCLANAPTDCKQLATKLVVNDIVCGVNSSNQCMATLKPSTEVGNYLCGYIYLKSLDKDCSRSLFVHVPPIGNPMTSQETSDAVFNIIKECVVQLKAKDNLD